MNEEKLLEKSLELTDATTQLQLVIKTLSSIEYSRRTNDEFGLTFHIQSGTLGLLNDVLEIVNASVSRISDEIYPDEKIEGGGTNEEN